MIQGRGGESALPSLVSEVRYIRGSTYLSSREPRPVQRRGYYEKSLTVATIVVAYRVFSFPLGGSSQRNKEDEEYQSTIGSHRVLSQRCHCSVQYYYHFIYDSRSKTLL